MIFGVRLNFRSLIRVQGQGQIYLKMGHNGEPRIQLTWFDVGDNIWHNGCLLYEDDHGDKL